MPNFNNWRNWRTNLLIRLGFHNLAQNYAYDFVGNDIKEENKKEEIDLLPTVMAWGWFKKVFRKAQNVLSFGASGRARRKAKRARDKYNKRARKAAKKYERTRKRLDKQIQARKSAYAAQRAVEQKALADSRAKTKAARERQAQVELEGKRSVGHAKNLAARDKRMHQQAALVEQEKADRAKRAAEKTSIGSPGTTSTKVTGPRGAGATTGKAGSVSGSARKLRKRLKDQETSLNI